MMARLTAVVSSLALVVLFCSSQTRAFQQPYPTCVPNLTNKHSRIISPHSINTPPTSALSLSLTEVGSLVQTGYHTAGVQKVLELGVIAGIGASLRYKLDAKAITTLLLSALVPAVIVSSLSTLRLSAEMGLVVLMGLLLTIAQIAAGELASRIVVKKSANTKAGRTIRRTAAMQLGSMAPALSVFSFLREFVGTEYAGLAALADIPSKLYILIFIRNYLRFRGVAKEESAQQEKKSSKLEKARSAFKDPFNQAIVTGLGLAAIGRPVPTLGFFGAALKSLQQAQTAVLFLLIGLKLKWGGERPKLCMRLLLARHGFMNLMTSLFLGTVLSASGSSAKLAAVLCSQAACSIIAYGQMNTVAEEVEGYDTDLAFDIVALSYPMTIGLNTAACLAKDTYVKALPVMGVGFLLLSTILGKFRRTSGEKS